MPTPIRLLRHRDLGINLTPMIDVVFLLLIFFVLIGQFSSRQRARVELPEPQPSAAKYIYTANVLTVTVICDRQGRVTSYQSQGRMIEPQQIAVLAEMLAAGKRGNPQVQVNLRADRRADAEIVEGLMAACAQVGIRQVNLVAATEDE